MTWNIFAACPSWKSVETQAYGPKRLLWSLRFRFTPILSLERASSVSDWCLRWLCHSINALRGWADPSSAQPCSEQARGQNREIPGLQRDDGRSVGPPAWLPVSAGLILLHGRGPTRGHCHCMQPIFMRCTSKNTRENICRVSVSEFFSRLFYSYCWTW